MPANPVYGAAQDGAGRYGSQRNAAALRHASASAPQVSRSSSCNFPSHSPGNGRIPCPGGHIAQYQELAF